MILTNSIMTFHLFISSELLFPNAEAVSEISDTQKKSSSPTKPASPPIKQTGKKVPIKDSKKSRLKKSKASSSSSCEATELQSVITPFSFISAWNGLKGTEDDIQSYAKLLEKVEPHQLKKCKQMLILGVPREELPRTTFCVIFFFRISEPWLYFDQGLHQSQKF